jgi:glycosyltransferase involved in cell wall biosynthesis
MKIKYISHGLFKTGGYRHEMVFYHALLDFLKTKVDSHEVCRKEKEFKSLVGYLYLLIWSFFKSNADINIVVARGALSAIIRHWFNQKEVYIVLHNYDENDHKSWLYGKYFKVLFRLLRKVKHSRFKFIAVSPYWVQYFKNEKGIKNVALFPNLFDTAYYETFKVIQKNKWVHLGQYSSKNDPQIFMLAKHLTQIGYYCYFSTLDNQLAKPHNGQFEIIYFMNYEDYLNQMALSSCTLALTTINEGWNRVAHESMLLGTPVIGYKKGGLGDLLRESQSVDVNNIDEAFTCILNSLWILPSDDFILKYDFKQAPFYLKEICQNH